MFECLHDLSFAELAPFAFFFSAVVIALIGALLVDFFPIFGEQERMVRAVIERLDRANAELKAIRAAWEREDRLRGST